MDLPAPDTHTEGDCFELVCSFTGVPAPEIRWEKNGSLFLIGKGRSINNNTGSSQLVIDSLALSDSGVTNMGGMTTKSVRLEVEEGQLEKSMLLIKKLNLSDFLPPTPAVCTCI